jgi:uncharacterized protein (TIGR02118 family)
MTIEAFQAHWRTTHAAIIGGLPGLSRYWQNHAVLRAGRPLLPWPGFDACSEMDAEDVAGFDALFASPRYRGEGRADEEEFVDRARGAAVVAARTFSSGMAGEAPARLLTFLRRAPGVPAAALGETLRHGGRGRGAAGREVFEAAPGQRAAPFDAVESLWFGSLGAAERHLTAPTAHADREALAGLVAGTERLLCEVVVVV